MSLFLNVHEIKGNFLQVCVTIWRSLLSTLHISIIYKPWFKIRRNIAVFIGAESLAEVNKLIGCVLVRKMDFRGDVVKLNVIDSYEKNK